MPGFQLVDIFSNFFHLTSQNAKLMITRVSIYKNLMINLKTPYAIPRPLLLYLMLVLKTMLLCL